MSALKRRQKGRGGGPGGRGEGRGGRSAMGTAAAAAWRAVGRGVAGEEFRGVLDPWVDAHCGVFEPEEENKLEYTALFREYEELVEKELEAGLRREFEEGFDWGEFMTSVPAHVEALMGAARSNEIAAAADADADASAQSLDVLLSLSDFSRFKDLMVLRRLELDGSLARAPPAAALDVGLDAELAAACQLAGPEGGWELVKEVGGIRIETGLQEQGGRRVMLARTTISVDMPMEEAENFWLNFTPERSNWDDHGVWEKLEGLEGECHRISFRVPLVKTFEFRVKTLERRDFPEPGYVTHVYRAIKPNGQLDFTPGVAVGKSVLRPSTACPGDTELVIVEELPSMVRYCPRFLVNWMFTSFVPKMITKKIAKYKQYKGL